jgi:uncharacterized RmlC-like cupin family protein
MEEAVEKGMRRFEDIACYLHGLSEIQMQFITVATNHDEYDMHTLAQSCTWIWISSSSKRERG